LPAFRHPGTPVAGKPADTWLGRLACQSARRFPVLSNLRFALRSLRRNPGFATAGVLTLGLGLGATTAIFAVVDSVVIEPLRYPEAGRLVWIDQPVPKYDARHPWGVSEVGYRDYATNVPALASLGAYTFTNVNVAGPDGVRRVRAVRATASVFDVLRATPALGRLYGRTDDRPGGELVAVLSNRYWRTAFGSDPDVVGRTLRGNGRTVTVVGVLPRGFRLPNADPDVWLPAQLDPAAAPVNSHYLNVVGRLAANTTVASVNAELNGRVARFSDLYPQAYYPGFVDQFGFRAEAVPLRERVVGDVAGRLWILLGAVGVVLLIAWANVANLFLVRTEGRRRALAMRSALGARRCQLAGHYVAESLVLTLLAGGVALWLADSGVRLLLALKPTGLPRLEDVALGWPAFMFCAGGAILSGVLFGLFPVIRSRWNYQVLREGSQGLTAGTGARRVREVLVAGQVAFAMVSLVAAGLLLRTFQELRAVEPGFDPARTLTLEVGLPVAGYRSYDATTPFWREAVERVGALPGVVSVGAGGALPVDDGMSCAVMGFEGSTTATADEGKCIPKALATPGYFEALGIPVRGRTPAWRDVDGNSGAVVVTRTLADRLWPGQDPIGKGIRPGGPGDTYYRVAGVTGNLHMDGLDAPPTPMVFFPVRPSSNTLPLWGPPRDLTLIVRTRTSSPEGLAGAIRRELAAIDAGVAVGAVRTMDEVESRSMAHTTFSLLLLSLAGTMALLLAAIGIYGVIAYAVARRRAELGVRMALGASDAGVRRLVVTEALVTSLPGVVVGVIAALLSGRLLRSLLYDVSPADPLVIAGAVVVILSVAALASYIPAVRAGRVDPMDALRCE
jgi:putative ABC transport system permease protein